MALCIFLACMVFFGLLVVPVLESLTAIIVGAAYGCIAVIGVIAYIKVSIVDPIHPRILSGVHKGELPCSRICRQCYIQIEDDTKHCNVCKKCVIRFDHHCIYLNTCIGKVNYRSFFVMISMCSLLTLFQTVMHVYLIGTHNTDPTQQEIDDIFWRDGVLFVSLSSVACCVSFGAFCAVFSLFLFHVNINLQGLTTYAWIIARREKKSARELEKSKANA